MQHSLLDILACPVCKGPLELRVAAEENGEITAGSLRCGKCGVEYPITEGIPDLLPPEKENR